MWTIPDAGLAAWTAGKLTAVDELLRATLHTPHDPFLTNVATHLLGAGGKRLRPALVLLSARFGEADHPYVVRAAACVELMHVASLYHDDVMDESATRRGVPSVNATWGNRVAILAGDYLAAKAAEIAAPLGTAALEEQARMLTRLVTGQLHETVGAGHADPEQYYMSVIADKTAALFALATRLGARASGAPAETGEALGRYGEALGVAFQLADDVLDLVEPSQDHTRAPGVDLRQGVATLPVLRALRTRPATRSGRSPKSGSMEAPEAEHSRRNGDAGRARYGMRDRVRLRRLLTSGPITDASDLATAARLLRRSPGFAETQAEVRRHAGLARQALLPLPATPAREALTAMCDYIVSRTTPTPT
ncbi:polyprenyl synthetase family protein [Sphaerisporangium fuscum]|uniref:polyprenyl synthetase family protein n=1 Tax=Sphaerisporangium fuscum TaxID=2835868 RepID=UPI001BDD03D5|nr:polyprenyl synthetase family protein [Sphaerisporangium fuscum]